MVVECSPKPKVVVFEQVPLFQHTSDYQRVLKVLGECYTVESRVLNCAHYGVPQQRKRLIVVGVRKDLSTRGAFHPAPSHRTPVSVAEAFAVAKPALGALLTGRVKALCEARYAMQQGNDKVMPHNGQ
jgi:DNA (cytosine-5)-methyltransferase 1